MRCKERFRRSEKKTEGKKLYQLREKGDYSNWKK